ncbi:dihydrofolate reductase [Hymenobacter sp. BT770]|uniref:dihydrofolate reductase n=1 Tax=Hymenobacter sp. BT770 TaxID=2886942 RepID=UPI001D124EDB|nr:dihydrofolate reductase [Hymenobacter sp. BT770]MCC3153116.1 dihydrofolate reductase [Hymenobacter sp. BT770]MDO3415410.1 dihydrofolate reductase [Hymenobacter sp. BT770]
MVSFVVAVAENGAIGLKGELPWGRLPADLQHFKRLTLGHPVVMGRRTYDSLGRALPKRPNIVVTRQPNWTAPGCETAPSVSTALDRARELDEEVCVIGGGEIYREALPYADVIYLTEVHHPFEGDAFFPALDPAEWREESRERHEADEQHAYPFSFVTLRRR